MTRKIMLLLLTLAAALGLALSCGGCNKKAEEKKTEKVETKETAKPAEAAKPATDAAKPAEPTGPATPAASPADHAACFGSPAGIPAREFEAAGHKYKVEGNKLTMVDALPGDQIAFGLMTDAKNAIEPTLANIDKILAWLKAEKADAVLVTGDSGEDYDNLVKNLSRIAQSGLLTVVIMGNREKLEDYNKAMEELGPKFPNLVNGNRVRAVVTNQAAVLTLAGYYDANYIHHLPGCLYGEKELVELAELRKTLNVPTVFMSHGPMRGVGKLALDVAPEAGNVGDPALAAFVKANNVPFGAFGNIHEAGGRAVGIDFEKPLEQNKPYDNVYVNPGPTDSDPWPMNDGTVSNGLAGLLTVKAGKGSFKIFRIGAK